MNLEQLRAWCLNKKAVEESFPFDEVTLVFKVMGKMFALTNIDVTDTLNLKCEPQKAIELRARLPDAVLPGWHMNKKHWNTIRLNAGLDDSFIKNMIDHSYELVVKSLNNKQKKELNDL